MYIVKNVQLPLGIQIDLSKALLSKFGKSFSSIGEVKILRKALDARKKNRLKFVFTLQVEGNPALEHPDIIPYKKPQPYIKEQRKLSSIEPFIIGAGPAGLFAALGLVEKGFKPVIFDRGESLEDRTKKVNSFWKNGILDEESNVQFGEGGAGTFSDGKLTSRSRDHYSEKIFDYLVKFGADEKIKYEALPHLGTDQLRVIIKKIREFLISQGCSFNWRHKLSQIHLKNNKINYVVIHGNKYKPEAVILAVGNSARDTFEQLNGLNALTSKPFAVGVRIEHTQEFINTAFYGDRTDITITGPATYRLTAKQRERGIYSFCMCPGGYVIGAGSEKGHLTVNGMSFSDRSNKFSNSAIVATVDSKDFGPGALAGIEFQRKIESTCFKKSHQYLAPVQSALDFINREKPTTEISCSYKPGVNLIDINTCLPEAIIYSLKYGLRQFDKRIPGFLKKGILIAPETRTSSPVRMTRHSVSFNSVIADNLFPAGEGSGYAGGIISSAVDGYKVAQIFSM
ncbi:NAD(P)/FAD-dependent oxidoreductase [Candidatus Cloacimonadota bacterium]